MRGPLGRLSKKVSFSTSLIRDAILDRGEERWDTLPVKARLWHVQRHGGIKGHVMGRKICSVCPGGTVGVRWVGPDCERP